MGQGLQGPLDVVREQDCPALSVDLVGALDDGGDHSGNFRGIVLVLKAFRLFILPLTTLSKG